jgi:hypothetical protein
MFETRADVKVVLLDVSAVRDGVAKVRRYCTRLSVSRGREKGWEERCVSLIEKCNVVYRFISSTIGSMSMSFSSMYPLLAVR